MSFFNLVHFFRTQHGRSRRWLGPIGLAAVLLFPLSTQSFAQDWGKWEEPSLGSDKGRPPGTAYPGGQQICEGMNLAGKHAYWRCVNRCGGRSTGGFCWEAISDAIYTCPNGKGFRMLEKIRYTSVPCGPKEWQQTKHQAELYGETWTKDIPDPPEVANPQTPPTEKADLPPTTDGTTVSWDGGGPPWAPKEAERKDDTNTNIGETDTAKTDTSKTATPKTDSGGTATDKKDTDKKDTATDKTTTEKKVTGTSKGSEKKANRKEAQKQGKSVARRRGDDDYVGRGNDISPEAAAAIGTGLLYGLGGGFGRGHMGGDRMGGSRMMDR